MPEIGPIRPKRATYDALVGATLGDYEIAYATDREELYLYDGEELVLTSKARQFTENTLPESATDGTFAYCTDSGRVYLWEDDAWVCVTAGVDADGTLDENSDNRVPTQKAVKTYVDAHADGTGAAVHGLGSVAVQDADSVAITGGTITGLTGFGMKNGSETVLFSTDVDGNITITPSGGTMFVAGSISATANTSFNVRHFGANGDGRTDDTAAIQDAIDAAAAALDWPAYSGTVVFPPGTYNTTGDFNLYGLNGINIIGAGTMSTTIRLTHASNSLFLVDKGLSATAHTYNITMSGFTVISDTVTRTKDGWIFLEAGAWDADYAIYNARFTDVEIHGQVNGFAIPRAWMIWFDRIYMLNCVVDPSERGYGIRLGYPSGVGIDEWALDEDYVAEQQVIYSSDVFSCILAHTSTADDAPGTGVNWETYWTRDSLTARIGAVSITNSQIQGHTSGTDDYTLGMGISAHEFEGIYLQNVGIEGCNENGLYAKSTGYASKNLSLTNVSIDSSQTAHGMYAKGIWNIQISNSYFMASGYGAEPPTPDVGCMWLDGCDHLIISGSRFGHCTGPGLVMVDCTGIVSACNFWDCLTDAITVSHTLLNDPSVTISDCRETASGRYSILTSDTANRLILSNNHFESTTNFGVAPVMATVTSGFDFHFNRPTGFGRTDPQRRVDILDTDPQLRLSYDADTYTEIFTDISGQAYIAPTSGKLVLGSTFPHCPQFILESVGDTGGPYYMYKKARAGATAVQSGDLMGAVLAYGFQNSNYRQSAVMELRVDGAPSGDYVPSKIVFKTADTTTGMREGMSLDSAGAVEVVGTLAGKLKEVVKSATGSLSVAECRNTVVTNLGQSAEAVISLPTAEAGLAFTVVILTGSYNFHLAPDTNDKIIYEATAGGDGKKLKRDSAAVSDSVRVFTVLTNTGHYDWVAQKVSGNAWALES